MVLDMTEPYPTSDRIQYILTKIARGTGKLSKRQTALLNHHIALTNEHYETMKRNARQAKKAAASEE
jgi:hypothetical protein